MRSARSQRPWTSPRLGRPSGGADLATEDSPTRRSWHLSARLGVGVREKPAPVGRLDRTRTGGAWSRMRITSTLLALATLLPVPPAGAAEDFLDAYAATLRFTLGQPRSITVTPD